MEKAPEHRQPTERGFWRFFDKLVNVMAAVAGLILVVITLAVCYTIGMRFLFTRTTIWIIPMTEYALLWIVFLATPWLLREGGHITTDIIYVHLRKRAKGSLDGVMYVVGGLACGTLVALGAIHLCDCIAGGVTDVRAVTVPKSAVFIIIPVGSLLLALQFFRMAWNRLTQIRTER